MHSAVLDATGYTLLLSSFITFVILLWKGCKRKKKSPFYVLSASDVFSATLTAIILLVNHIEAGIKLSYNWQNHTSSNTPNHIWTIEDNYRSPFLQPHDLREAANEVDLNLTLTCGMKDILMQYGMLLAALANAFISVLTFTVQCNLNAACVKRRCANIMKSSLKNTQLEPKDSSRVSVKVKCRESEILENEQESTFQQQDSIDVKTRSNIMQTIMRISKFRTLKGDKKPIGFLVTSHWLVPFLVTGILYFAEYSDMNNVRHTEDTECIFESNFPMNDFDTFSDTDDYLNITDSVAYMTSPERNYFFNEMLSNKSKPSSTEIDEVISKIQSIVKTALNHTRNSTEDMEKNFLATPEPQNLTEYILANNIIRYIKNITNIDNVTQRLNGTLIERDISVHNSSINNNIYLSQDPEVPLLYNESRNASEELDATTSGNLSSVLQVSVESKDDIYQEDAQIHFASTEESTTQRTTTISFVQNTTFVSNDQIYGEIMKRIQAASVHLAVKNHYNRSASRAQDGDQSKWSNPKNYIANRKPNSIKDLLSNRNDNFNRHINAETRQSSSLHMINECLVSTRFLKLHLFVLSVAIYFLPILLSCILQMRGKHMCKDTLAILKAKTDSPSMDGKRIHRQNSAEGFSMHQGLRNDHNRTDIDAIKDHESCRENENIALEINCMVRILDTIKLSLILCVVLWTPVFLGTLLRVLSCTRAPQWLTDVTFLSAISFGIIRNALNINIIRIQEACSDASMKENKIHPVE